MSVAIDGQAINRVLATSIHSSHHSEVSIACKYENADLFLVDGYPICSGIPLVAFDVIHTILQIPVTFCQINLQQISQKILQIRAKVGRKSYLKYEQIALRICTCNGIHVGNDYTLVGIPAMYKMVEPLNRQNTKVDPKDRLLRSRCF